jgi:hypothetical protein
MYQQQPMYHRQPARSAIPKVIGILMIIFASLGLFGSLIAFVSRGGGVDDMFRDVPELRTWNTISTFINVLGLGIGCLHLYTGLRCVGYKTNAPALAKAYAIVAIVVTITNAILVYAWAKPLLERAFGGMPGGGIAAGVFGPIMLFSTVISMAWPIVVLALMSRPAAKAACVNQL